MKTRIALITLLIMGSVNLNAQTIMNIHQSNGTVLQIPLNTIDSITYTINNPGSLASITTATVTSITGTTAVSGGNIPNDGGSLITQRGICYSTTPTPTTANTTVISGSGTGSFTCNLSGLTPSTTYYVRAYAINSAGTAYGNALSFTATSGGSGISNPGAGVTFDGYTYSSVVLGNGQEWMAENLRTTVYANGDPIPNVTDVTEWQYLSTGAWAHYNNDSQYENPYGKLYNWFTVADARNVCPTGWHVSTDGELTVLRDYLGGEAYAGYKMKSPGTQYWVSPNTDATNESGFSGLPGGFRGSDGFFNSIGGSGIFWSSTEFQPNYAWRFYLSYINGYFVRSFDSENVGYSIRCLKD
jgi:uncharacterized protein (TIGR02145 family)